MLPLPDSRVGPGTIVQLSDAAGVDYLGEFTDCGVPQTAIETVSGALPNFDLSTGVDFSAKVLVTYQGVSVGPEYDKLSTAKLQVQQWAAPALKRLKLSIWLADPTNLARVSPTCREWVNRPEVYLISEALQITQGTYELKDSSGAKIDAKIPEEIARYVNIGANAELKKTADGKTIFSVPTTLAVRKVEKLAPGFANLGDDDHKETADARLRTIWQPRYQD
jgi:hypothetical protein